LNPSHGLSWEKSGEQEGVFATLFILTGKLGNYGNDIIMGKLLSVNDNYILDLFKNAPANYSPTFGQLNIGGPIVAYIMQKHSDYYGGAVIVFGYNNFRPIYYHIVNGTINAEYYL
jgi:hypothetical protein